MEKITATKQELSEATGLTGFQIDQLRRDKLNPLPSIKAGKNYVYPIKEVTEYFKKQIKIGSQKYYATN